jgi:hypothetical protein
MQSALSLRARVGQAGIPADAQITIEQQTPRCSRC